MEQSSRFSNGFHRKQSPALTIILLSSIYGSVSKRFVRMRHPPTCQNSETCSRTSNQSEQRLTGRSAHRDRLPQVPQVFWITFDQRLKDRRSRLPFAERWIQQQCHLRSFRRTFERCLDGGVLICLYRQNQALDRIRKRVRCLRDNAVAARETWHFHHIIVGEIFDC